ncbi:MAG: molybdopterin-dependent oxidoreductase [Clostridiaceae bacterium]
MKKIVTLIIIGLAIIVGVSAYLNRGNIEAKKESQDNATISFKSNGSEVAKKDMNFVKTLAKSSFSANLKANGKKAVKHTYTGVPLKKVFEALNIKLDGKSQVIVTAADGYATVLTIDEVNVDDNVYLAYEMDGKPLGTKKDGGSGPFEVIIKNDSFSQRWCKFVSEVELK